MRAYRVLSYPGAAAHRVIRAKKAMGGKIRKAAWVLAAVLVIAVGAVEIWNIFLRPSIPPIETASVKRMAFPLPDKPSIAVLPFVNMSEDPSQEYFSDGITEDLITDLSKISELFVIARTSVFSYKNKPVQIRQVAEELGVRYVLEGSVRRAGDQVRIMPSSSTPPPAATYGQNATTEKWKTSLPCRIELPNKSYQHWK